MNKHFIPGPLSRICLIFWALIALVNPANAQDDISLTQFLNKLSGQYQVTFLFNQSLFDQLSTPDQSCETLPICLQKLADDYWLSVELQSDGSYLLIPENRATDIDLLEADSGEPLDMIRWRVNDGEWAYLFPSQNDRFTLKSVFLADTIYFNSRFFVQEKIQLQELLTDKGGQLQLTPVLLELDEVIIQDYISKGVEIDLANQGFSVDMSELGLLAGEADGDLFNVLKRLPGIRTPDGKPGNINFRGSTFDHNLIFFDGIPIYHQGHFGGTISPYNPATVKKVDVVRGVLPAERGGKLGGLFDISTANSRAPDSAQYQASISTLTTGVKVELPLIKEQTDVLLAFRTRTPGAWLSPKLEAYELLNYQGSNTDPNFATDRNFVNDFDFNYSDVNARLTHRFSKKSQLSVSGIDIRNDLLRSAIRRESDLQTEKYQLQNRGYTINYAHHLGEDTKVNVAVTDAEFRLREDIRIFRRGNLDRSQSLSQTLSDFRVTVSGETAIGARTKVKGGYQLSDHTLELFRRQEETIRTAAIHALHGTFTQTFGDQLVLNAGLRAEHFDLQSSWVLDPRISLSYSLSKYLFLKSAFGSAHQYLRQFQPTDFNDFRVRGQLWRLVEETEPLMTSKQGMLGLLYDKAGWQIDLELYLKRSDGLLRQVNNMQDVYGEIDVTGLDLFVKRRFNHVDLWVSYSLSVANEDFGSEQTSFFDQTHLFNITSQWKLNRWAFAASWVYLSGMPVVIPEGSAVTVPYTGRFPAQHQLDISATYKCWYVNGLPRVTAGLSLTNLYDQQNIINVFQNDPPENNPIRLAVGFAPDFSIKVNF